MNRTLRALVMLALWGVPLFAQKTGTLLHQTDSTRRARRPFEPGATVSSEARGDTIFAALVFDPSLAAPARSSACTANAVHASPTTEARIQANLGDLADALFGAKGAASLMVAGPFNKDNKVT